MEKDTLLQGNLFALLNLSPPVHQQNRSSYNEKLDQESQLLLKNVTKSAGQELLHNCKNHDDTVNVVTSFDGSWGSPG